MAWRRLALVLLVVVAAYSGLVALTVALDLPFWALFAMCLAVGLAGTLWFSAGLRDR
jgi:hypothetical protein